MNPFLTDIIGSEFTITEHTDPSLKNLRGRVIDERKNIVVIEAEGRRKTIPKSRSNVLIDGIEVDLEQIRMRPHEKMKKLRRRNRI